MIAQLKAGEQLYVDYPLAFRAPELFDGAIWIEEEPLLAVNTLAGEKRRWDDMSVPFEGCWKCGTFMAREPRLVPYLCRSCELECSRRGFSDPVEDLPLLVYLHSGQHYTGLTPEQQARVERVAEYYMLEVDTTAARSVRLFALHGGAWKQVPPIHLRGELIRTTHETARHVGADKVLGVLQVDYWWPQMRRDIVEIVRNCR